MKRRSNSIWISFLLLPFLSFSQLVVTSDSSATMLAQAIAGNGVVVSNATINCAGQSCGNFTYSGANLGLTNGIILTSGNADSAVWHGAGIFPQPPSTGIGTTYSDPDLVAISSGAINDVCLIAFDFVPICNNVSITYVFASSEYDVFVC